jgi:hypothetical protein
MKSDKPSLKKTIKAATKSVRERASDVADRLKKTKTAADEPAAMASEKSPAKPAAGQAAKPKSKSQIKKEGLEVPPILLEGDQPPAAPAAGGPGKRYELGPVPPPEQPGAFESAGELPEAYGTQRLLLTARDPHWLYARWDMTREQQRRYNRLSTDGHLVLHIFTNEAKGRPENHVHVHPESTHWFVPVAAAGTKYVGVIGYYQTDGKWVAISTSDATMTPPDTMSEDTSAQFATIPIEVPFAQLMELARSAVRENIPLAEILQQLRASGYHVADSPTGKWTPEQEQALAAIISMDRVRRVWMGSIEITELIRRRLQQEISSMALAQITAPSSPIGAISSFSSLASPFGGMPGQKGFWFNVNAELIIYGATEPDAEVTIGGRVIKLRPDGTFSYRFALPDGKYELPAVAIAADKSDGRAAELKFGRDTQYRGEVGAHPQDPQLKAPLVENVS